MNQAKSGKQGGSGDAIAQLSADHQLLRQLFQEFAELEGDTGQDELKAELVAQVCYELSVHSQVEEEIFYPAVRSAMQEDELVDQAEAEHAGIKDLVSQLEAMETGNRRYDATMTVLSEEFEHHVGMEEGEIFPNAKRLKIDTRLIGERIGQRREELEQELSGLPGARTTGKGKPSQPRR